MLENFKQNGEAHHLRFSYQAYLSQALYKYPFQLRTPFIPLGNTVLCLQEQETQIPRT